MQNLAPNITRQRLLIEAKYSIEVDELVIKDFFKELLQDLNLRAYGEPIIFSPTGMGKEGNQGYDAFIPLIDSGISLYIWSGEKFLSMIIYTCKSFDADTALRTTQSFFQTIELESNSF